MYFTRSSKPIITREQRERAEREEQQFWGEHLKNAKHLAALLLDSSLITPSKVEKYDTKVVRCGKYVQVYKYQKEIEKNKKGIEKEKEESRVVYNILNVDTDDLESVEKNKKEEKEIKLKKIEEKNIKRSKFQLQRIVKSNEDLFKTFITLTFANFEKIVIDKKSIYYWLCPNINIPYNLQLNKKNKFNIIVNKIEFNKKIENYTSISKANEKFDNWRSNLKKRLKEDFVYVCVPEFQKNGTVHYHLLTNIEYDDYKLLSQEEIKIYKKNKGWQVFRTLKSWKYGYSNVIPIENINIVGYMSKYMTKDIDNRLFGRRRYLYSQCLSKPSVIYLDSSTDDRLTKILGLNYYESFKNVYADKNGLAIDFIEYKSFEELEIEEVLSS